MELEARSVHGGSLIEVTRTSGKSAGSACTVFLHVPKTAGWTLRGVFRYKYPSRIVFADDVFDRFGGITNVPIDERRRAKVVTGHIFHGIHEEMPQECRYMTVLRDPVARVVSMYGHVLRRPQHRLHSTVRRSGMDLEQFAREIPDPGVDNQQTRLISGRGYGEMLETTSGERIWVAPKLTRDDLELAKSNLDSYLVVGLTERFDETFILIRRAMGWRLPMYATRNVGSTGGPAREPPSDTAVELITERNQLDIELYAHAEQLFNAAVASGGSSLSREVAAFAALNRIPNALGPKIPSGLRRPLRTVLPR